MAAILWGRIRNRIRPAAPNHEQGLRRVAFRLAAQTVVLLLVMLLVLEVVVYLITQQTLLGSLQNTVQTRAAQPDPELCTAFHLHCETGGRPPGGGRQGPLRSTGGRGSEPRVSGSPAPVSQTVSPSEAGAVYVNRQLGFRHSDEEIGNVLLDRSGAAQAIATGKGQCCSVRRYRGQDFLVYSAPLMFKGTVIGAVQTSISEHQYEHTLNILLKGLILVTILGLVGSGLISAALARRALQPIRLSMQRQLDFVADAAHELRTPLAIQRTVAEVGLIEAPGENQQGTIEQMLAENQHLTRLVDDLSLLARADSQAIAIERRPVDLSGLVMDTTSELEPLAQEQDIRLVVEVDGNVRVLGDVLRLRQLLLILLDNALKHTPAGGEVNVSLRPHSSQVRLQVTDSGPGINPTDLPRIFDRFYQADQARTGEGSGLGLAIGRWITNVHGGQIQAGNAAPHGATFTVTLPLARLGAPS